MTAGALIQLDDVSFFDRFPEFGAFFVLVCFGTLRPFSWMGTKGSLKTECTHWFFDLTCLVKLSLNLIIK